VDGYKESARDWGQCGCRALYYACLFDILTSSDIAYIMWQYVNSYDDWCTKLTLLKEDKTVNMNKSERLLLWNQGLIRILVSNWH
jgi:hypothetical protein